MSSCKGRTSRGIDWEYNSVRGFSFPPNSKKNLIVKFSDKAEAYTKVMEEKAANVKKNLPGAIQKAVTKFFDAIDLSNTKLFQDICKASDPVYARDVLSKEINSQQNDPLGKPSPTDGVLSIENLLKKELIAFGTEEDVIRIVADHRVELFDETRKYLDFWMEK